MNNELRTQMQTQAIDTLFEKKRLIVEWGTGVGKSRVAVNAVMRLLREGKKNILMLVAETSHKTNWRNEFTDALGVQVGMSAFSSLTVECYASLPKYEGTSWDMVIADEAHHLRSDNRTDIVSTLTTEYFLCLSATMSDRDDALGLLRMLEVSFGKFESIKFGIQDAINHEILSKPEITIHVLDITKCDGQTQVEVSWGFPNAQREAVVNTPRFYEMWENPRQFPNMKLTVNCTPLEGYKLLQTVYESCKVTVDKLTAEINSVLTTAERRSKAERQLEYARNRMLQYALRRKQLLGACKTEYARHVINDVIGDKKFVCFCSSIPQGQDLNAETIIHSKRSSKDNLGIIEDFNRGKYRSLFAVGMIQEGSNLAGIQAGLIIQLDKKQRAFVQKFGRTMRSKAPEQHIIVFNHTKDINYLKNILEGISKDYVKWVNGNTGARMQ